MSQHSGDGSDEHAGDRGESSPAPAMRGKVASAPRSVDHEHPALDGERREVSVGQFLQAVAPLLNLQVCAGADGLARPICHPRIQKNGLALAGHLLGVVPTRIQVLGETELAFLRGLDAAAAEQALASFFALGLSCVVLSKDQTPPAQLQAIADATSTPLMRAAERTSKTINAIHACLDDQLAPTTSLHGVLVDVFGVGILLLGKSGIGKSECALELVLRGHRLVADDVVRCDFRPPGMLFGAASTMLRHHIEIRGLGILNIQDLFGVTSVRERKRIDLVVRLAEFRDDEEYDRLGVEDHFENILGAQIRTLKVPVKPGRDMGSILEIAARNELLRRAGTHSARNFLTQLEARRRNTLAELAAKPAPVAPESSVACAANLAGYETNVGGAGHSPVRPAPQPPRAPTLRPAQSSTRRSFAGGDESESSAWIPAPWVRKDEDP